LRRAPELTRKDTITPVNNNTRVLPFRDRLRMRRRLVLFICTGNTCRSPMAAAYMRKLLEERGVREIDVRSAGVMTITGLLASQEAVQVMEEAGVDLKRHRSTQLTPELIRKADLILAMSPFHRQTALRMSDEAKNKTFLLKEFTRSDLKNVQIADPMGCTLEVFKKCFKEIKAACDRFIDHEYVTGRPAGTAKPVAKPTGKQTAKPGKKSAKGSGGKAKPAKAAAKKPAAKPAKAAAKK
jgi:protein-tyrosine phosphatase